MKSSDQELKDYIEAGEYFTDAKLWYRHIYIYPFSYRSFFLIICIVVALSFISILLNINSLLPIVRQVRYSINDTLFSSHTAKIYRANQVKGNPQASIAQILVKEYLMHREEYDYQNMKEQFTYLYNNSTRVVFRKFYTLMSIDNPDSPVLKYRKTGKRTINIISVEHLSSFSTKVTYSAKLLGPKSDSVKTIYWESTIEYDIDTINPDVPSGTRFKFTVTNYSARQKDNINLEGIKPK